MLFRSTGSILGVGVGKKGADVRWNVAGRMATAWLFTLPCAALVGAGCEALAKAIHGLPGVLVALAILIAIATLVFIRARRNRVGHDNVNEEWSGSVAPEQEPATV